MSVRKTLSWAVLSWFLGSAPAWAELPARATRVGIDVDVFSAGAVWTRADGEHAHHVGRDISVGPNQLGNSLATLPNTPVGIGVDWVLGRHWLLGARVGFGYDRLSSDRGPDTKALAVSLMPDVAYVFGNGDVKPFVRFSPVAQYSQLKLGDQRGHLFNGCFSVGGGALLFTSARSSIDLGAYFEGRFGELKGSGVRRQTDVDDLRGVLRLGVSLWI